MTHYHRSFKRGTLCICDLVRKPNKVRVTTSLKKWVDGGFQRGVFFSSFFHEKRESKLKKEKNEKGI